MTTLHDEPAAISGNEPHADPECPEHGCARSQCDDVQHELDRAVLDVRNADLRTPADRRNAERVRRIRIAVSAISEQGEQVARANPGPYGFAWRGATDTALVHLANALDETAPQIVSSLAEGAGVAEIAQDEPDKRFTADLMFGVFELLTAHGYSSADSQLPRSMVAFWHLVRAFEGRS